MDKQEEFPVLIERRGRLLALVLNRPRVLNCLNLDMIRRLQQALQDGQRDEQVRLIVLSGAGERAFCAGGDLKELLWAVAGRVLERTDEFFQEEYALDLLVHQFPKPVVVLADGVTMGGGLGLAAGADLVVATERSRLAMPETRIGFFPDVGATGWLFAQCPPGYPEYLALTGYEMAGGEAVRLGLASHLVPSTHLAELHEALVRLSDRLSPDKDEAVRQLRLAVDSYAEKELPSRPELDAWVAEHFAGKKTLGDIVGSLGQCRRQEKWCAAVFQSLSERSPTALTLTLQLLRANEGRPLPEVFQREIRAGRFMIQQPDYLEGIRARLIDKDDQPHWQPGSIGELAGLEVEL